MVECWEDGDVISKLLCKKDNDVSIVCEDEEIYSKSLHEELMELDECSSKFSLKNIEKNILCDVRTSEANSKCREKCPEKKKEGFKVKNMMLEFLEFSGIMDREIIRYEMNNNIKERQEPLQFKEEGKVSNKFLLEQHSKVTKYEEQKYMKLKPSKKEDYTKKTHILRYGLNQHAYVIHDDLQKEFNKILNEKEQEIENLSIENIHLRKSLSTKEFAGYKLDIEDTELKESVRIKDEAISSLRLQVKNLEKQHQQYEWKLEQGDDILEMVEKERDVMEEKYKIVILNLRRKLKSITSSTVGNKSSDSRKNSKVEVNTPKQRLPKLQLIKDKYSLTAESRMSINKSIFPNTTTIMQCKPNTTATHKQCNQNTATINQWNPNIALMNQWKPNTTNNFNQWQPNATTINQWKPNISTFNQRKASNQNDDLTKLHEIPIVFKSLGWRNTFFMKNK